MVECCNKPEGNFFSYGYNEEVVGPGGSIVLEVRNGCGNFTWVSDNGDFTFDDGAETAGRTNTLYAASGAGNESANITVTDSCGASDGGIVFCRVIPTITYVSNSTVMATYYYDNSSENVCELLTAGYAYIQDQNLYYTDITTLCSLPFYESVRVIQAFCIKFSNITPPDGTLVKSILRLITNGSGNYRELTFDIYGNDVGDAVIPSTYADFYSKTLTTALTPVSWAASYTDGNIIDYDVTSIMQEILARGDWASGNAIQFLSRNPSTSSLAFKGSGWASQYRPNLINYWV